MATFDYDYNEHYINVEVISARFLSTNSDAVLEDFLLPDSQTIRDFFENEDELELDSFDGNDFSDLEDDAQSWEQYCATHNRKELMNFSVHA